MQSIDSRIITNTKSGNNHRTKRGSRKWKSYPHCLRDGPELTTGTDPPDCVLVVRRNRKVSQG